MHTLSKNILVLVGSLGLVLSPAAQAQAGSEQAPAVKVESVDSSSVNITDANLRVTGTTVELQGEVRNRFPTRGPIPGHLQIELIAPDGKIFKKATIGYRRLSIKSDIARFQLPIPVAPSSIDTIRITHHDARSDMHEQKTLWQDVSHD